MINKLIKTVFAVLLLVTAFSKPAFAQIDSEAVTILDNMSSVVTGLESCSFTLKTQYDIYDDGIGLIKHSDVADVSMKAPDKLLVKRTGDKGDKNFYYDGKTFSYFSVDNNQYASAPAPSSIMETIDSLSNQYGIDFPAADIFYPDLVDDIIDGSDDLAYLGLTMVDGRLCHHIAGATKELTFQIWVADDGSFLPVKIAIVYTEDQGNPQYEALFTDWKLNPQLEDSMFDFTIPSGAAKIKFLNNKTITE